MGNAETMRRFHVVEQLEEHLSDSTWKGEDHAKGIYFTEHYGYAANKLFAIRAKHEEQAAEVFYKFESDEDEEVTRTYPFYELQKRPKNHHLLFEDEEMSIDDVDAIFNDDFTYGSFFVELQPLIALLEKVSNKRERERSYLSMELTENESTFRIIRKKSKQRITRFSDIIKSNRLTSKDIIDFQKQEWDMEHWKSEDEKNKNHAEHLLNTVNAHIFLRLLKIFSPLEVVHFLCGHDRIMITGNHKEMREKNMPATEVVLSLVKNV